MLPVSRLPRRLPLRVHLSLAFAGVVVLTVLLLGAAAFLTVRYRLRSELRQRLQHTAVLAAKLIDPVAHRRIQTAADETLPEYRGMRTQLYAIRLALPDVRFIYTMRRTASGRFVFVLDAEEDGSKDRSHPGDVYETPTRELEAAFQPPYRVIVEHTFTADRWGTWLSGFAPLRHRDGSLEAVVGVDIAARQVLAYERQLLWVIALISLAIAALVLGIAVYVARSVSRPLVVLASDMSRIRQFDLVGQSPVDSRIVEVAAMGEAVNDMRQGLRSFRRYVPAELVGELIRLGQEATLAVEKREVTVFFSDVQDFTGISERLPPEELRAALEVYFRGLTSIIHAQQGTLDKYIGDCIMAFWGAPHAVPAHPLLACRAALASQAFLRQQNTAWAAAGAPPFLTRIGLNTGEVLVGNIGYEERFNYTVMGDPVNVASRLELLNKYYGTRILIGESTYRAAAAALAVRLLDVVAVKGRRQPVRVYELVGEAGSVSKPEREFLQRFSQGVELYLERQWVEALAVFTETSRQRPEDQPSHLYLDRCEQCLAIPPPVNWDGTTVMRVK